MVFLRLAALAGLAFAASTVPPTTSSSTATSTEAKSPYQINGNTPQVQDVKLNDDKENYNVNVNPVEYVRYELLNMIRGLVGHEEQPGDTYGVLIRLMFHDAGSYDKYRGTGGAHACIAVPCAPGERCEYRYAQHAGLPEIIDEINALYDAKGMHTVISRADFLHFATFLAVKLSAPQYTEELYFNFGRTDCPHRLPYFGNMPDSELFGFDYYYSFFDTWGLTPTDMIALLGAHTVGRAERKYSGYEGAWVYKQDILDNEYYKVLYDPNFHWYRATLPNPKLGDRHFFTSGEDSPVPWRTMLHADMSLFWDISDGYCEVNVYGGHGKAGGYSQYYDPKDKYNHDFSYGQDYGYNAHYENGVMRQPRECPKNEWWGLLELYANDNYAWMHDFNIAWKKMQELGMYHAYGKGLGPVGYNGYDGYGGYGQGNAQTWGQYGGEYATWGSGYKDPKFDIKSDYGYGTKQTTDDYGYGGQKNNYGGGYQKDDYGSYGQKYGGGYGQDSYGGQKYGGGYGQDSYGGQKYGGGYGQDSYGSYGQKYDGYGQDSYGSYGQKYGGDYGSKYGSGYGQDSYSSYGGQKYGGGYGQKYGGGYGQDSYGSYGQKYGGGYGQDSYGSYGQKYGGGYGQDSYGSYGQKYSGDSGSKYGGGYGQDSYSSYGGQKYGGGYGQDDDYDSYGQDDYGSYGQKYGGYGQDSYGSYGQKYGGDYSSKYGSGYGQDSYGGWGSYGQKYGGDYGSKYGSGYGQDSYSSYGGQKYGGDYGSKYGSGYGSYGQKYGGGYGQDSYGQKYGGSSYVGGYDGYGKDSYGYDDYGYGQDDYGYGQDDYGYGQYGGGYGQYGGYDGGYKGFQSYAGLSSFGAKSYGGRGSNYGRR
eukprot:g17832.t1